MVELEGLDLKDSYLDPLNLIREITPRSSKVRYDKMFLMTIFFPAADKPGPWRAACLPLPPARVRQDDCCGAEGKESAQDGPDRAVR